MRLSAEGDLACMCEHKRPTESWLTQREGSLVPRLSPSFSEESQGTRVHAAKMKHTCAARL